MEAITFVLNYQSYIDRLEKVVREEFKQIIEELRMLDPHDLVSPDTFFLNDANAMGFVFNLFLKSIKD